MKSLPVTSGLRASIRRHLPKLLRKAIADYGGFAAQPAPDDAKAFAGHQAACKAALAHLDTGTTLLAWAEKTDGADDDGGIARLIRRAEEAIATADADLDADEF